MRSIFLIDDEENQLKILSELLRKRGYSVYIFQNPVEAIKKLKEFLPFLIITDMKMPQMSGKDILKYVKNNLPDTELIIITGYGDVAEAVDCLKSGAYYYMLKPIDINELYVIIRRLEETKDLRGKNELLRETIESIYGDFIFKDKKMIKLVENLKKAAKTEAPILIEGETGTGKEVLARFIHKVSGRKGEFIAVNTASLPSELIESELFGYKKGSFTGAIKDKPGKIELANNGTLFLDEIGDMPLNMQVKLLRVLETKEVESLGNVKPVKVNIRIIAATSRDLKRMISNGAFREDLYYRISTVPVKLPPLRERKEDIIYLAKYFIESYSRKMHKEKIPILTDKAKEMLLNYEWRGNVRELKNVIERSLIFSDDNEFVPILDNYRSKSDKEEFIPLKELEKEYIRKVLNYTRYNKGEAAKLLGIHRNTLTNKIKEYGLEEE